jgi:nuclear GTP-binding protein
MHLQAKEPSRIQPDRRWFGNTRVITQDRLQEFRETMEKARKDPYHVVLKKTKLPVALFEPEPQTAKQARVDLLSMEPFEKTFGKNFKRKRPKLLFSSLANLANQVGDY